MKRKMIQQSFSLSGFEKPKDAFGGSLLKGNPKGKRPLDSKLPLLLTMRAHKSVLRLPRTFARVQEIIAAVAAKHGFTVYEQANVGNHLHLLIKIPHVRAWAAFIRELSGRIAQAAAAIIEGVKDGSACGAGFWLYRPHTRIVRGWGKAYRVAKDYVGLNQLEALGFISRKETKTLKDLRMIWADD